MTKEEAENTAKESKIELLVEEQFDKEVEVGKVISQDPGFMENYMVKEGSTVKIVVSKGTDLKKVPKVTGKTYEEAETELTELSLVPNKVEESSEKVEAGYVIRQDPAPDTELNSGETVTVYVSTGVKQITMQHVIGQKEAEAKKALTKAGFEVSIVYEEDTSKEDGIVLKQSIDADARVKDGSKVTLTVNKIAALKEGTVNINLKSITGGVQVDEEGTEINPTALVEVKVTSEGSEDTVYKETHRKDTSNINIQVSGKGTITVKVFVDGVRKATEQLNLNASKPVLNID